MKEEISYALHFGLPAIVFAVGGFFVNLTFGIAAAALLTLIVPVALAVGATLIAQLAALLTVQAAQYSRLKKTRQESGGYALLLVACATAGYIVGGSVPWIVLFALLAERVG